MRWVVPLSARLEKARKQEGREVVINYVTQLHHPSCTTGLRTTADHPLLQSVHVYRVCVSWCWHFGCTN